MPGIKLKLDTKEAEAASKALKRSLKDLGLESKVTERQFKALERNLIRVLITDLNHSEISKNKNCRG